MPDWLLWLLPVPVATLLAALWAVWAARTPPPQRTADSVAERERFRAALARPPADPRRVRRDGHPLG